MLKIQRFVNGEFVIPALSGRIEAENLEHLQALLRAERQRIVLDLNEVNLVSRDGGNSWRVPSRMAFAQRLSGLHLRVDCPESEEESDSFFRKVSRDTIDADRNNIAETFAEKTLSKRPWIVALAVMDAVVRVQPSVQRLLRKNRGATGLREDRTLHPRDLTEG